MTMDDYLAIISVALPLAILAVFTVLIAMNLKQEI